MQGVERYKVRLLPHCEEWKDEFKEAKKQLKEIFGDNIKMIYEKISLEKYKRDVIK